MADTNCNQWLEWLKFVQVMKNMDYRDGIKQPPIGPRLIAKLKSEKDLNRAVGSARP